MRLRLSICLTVAAMLALPLVARAQAPADTLPAAPDTLVSAPNLAATQIAVSTQQAPAESRVYYGGSVGFSFWNDYFRISLEPLVALKLTPKFSVGGKVRYEYLNDNRSVPDYDSHNYGASVFTRYRVIPQVYAHGEFAAVSYDFSSGRETVPFLLLGGGFSQPVGQNTWAYVEILWDVLLDDDSPYEDGQPLVSVGVGIGF